MQTSAWLILLMTTIFITVYTQPEQQFAEDGQEAGPSDPHHRHARDRGGAFGRLKQAVQRNRGIRMNEQKSSKREQPLNIEKGHHRHRGRRLRKMHSRRHKDLTSKREKVEEQMQNEPLCPTVENIFDMETEEDEFIPPIIKEIRCRNVIKSDHFSERQEPPTCVRGMLRCVQVYQDVHLTWRRKGKRAWHPYVVQNVPSGCECMWPVDKLGHQEL